MYQKGRVPSVFASTNSASRPSLESSELYETEFEEDVSDFEEYSGRRSEDSVSILVSGERSIMLRRPSGGQAKRHNAVLVR